MKHRLKPCLSSMAAILAAIFVEQAQAQIQTQPTEIITASPLSAFSERAGAWPSVVTPNDLIQSETEPITRYLNTIPGVQARQTGSPTVSIRGSSQAGRVLSLYDGVPLVFADGFGAPEILLPTEILGELRLVKGPASVFYGPYAMAGALNHIPRVFERPAVRLAASDQDGGLATTSALGVLPYKWSEGNFIQVSAYSENEPGDFPYESVSTKIRGRRSNNKTFTHRYTLLGQQKGESWSIRERVVFGRDLGTSPGPVSSPFPTPFETWAALGSTDLTLRLTQESDLSLKLSQLWRESLFDAKTPAESRSILTKSMANADFGWVFPNLIVSRTFLDVSYDTFDSEGYVNGEYYEDSVELGEILEVPLGRSWGLQAGARWLTSDGRVFKSLGTVRETDASKTWLTYSEGFRRPSLYDRYSNNALTIGNPGLQPETSSQVELGFLRKPREQHRTFIEGFTWGAALYAINYRDFFENEQVSATQARKRNRGKAGAQGGEVSAGYAVGPWTVGASYNYLEGKNRTTREALTLSPRHQLTATVTQALGPLVIELKDTYWSEFHDREFPSGTMRALPDWNIVDLNFRTIGFADWEFKAGVLNLFDQPRELTLGYPEPQRTFYLSALAYF